MRAWRPSEAAGPAALRWPRCCGASAGLPAAGFALGCRRLPLPLLVAARTRCTACLLYTSDAADDM
eukprot:431573-Alexandrium_andersonii.AAC.1